MKKYHPDSQSGFSEDEKAKLINEAYEVLSDPVARQEYDAHKGMDGRAGHSSESSQGNPPPTPPEPPQSDEESNEQGDPNLFIDDEGALKVWVIFAVAFTAVLLFVHGPTGIYAGISVAPFDFLIYVFGGSLPPFLISLGIVKLWGAIQRSPVSLKSERYRWLALEIVFLVLVAIGLYRGGTVDQTTNKTGPPADGGVELTVNKAPAETAGESPAVSEVGPERRAFQPISPPAGRRWEKFTSITPEGGYLLGNPGAPLKLVEYASYTCGACAYFSMNGLPALKEDYISKGVVSLELRNLIRDPVDLTIAALVRCGQPENMHPFSEQAWAALSDIYANLNANAAVYEAVPSLPTNQRFVAIGEAAGLIDFFAARGLPSSQARNCLADGANIEAIAGRSLQQSQELGVNSTPTFFLNGAKLEVNQWHELEPVLQLAGA